MTILTFEARNLNRVIKEVKIYNYKPFIETYYKIDRIFFYSKKIDNLKNEDGPFSKTVFADFISTKISVRKLMVKKNYNLHLVSLVKMDLT